MKNKNKNNCYYIYHHHCHCLVSTNVLLNNSLAGMNESVVSSLI